MQESTGVSPVRVWGGGGGGFLVVGLGDFDTLAKIQCPRKSVPPIR